MMLAAFMSVPVRVRGFGGEDGVVINSVTWANGMLEMMLIGSLICRGETGY
jgi:hypothetical protein